MDQEIGDIVKSLEGNETMQEDDKINISDVIEVIETTDPDYSTSVLDRKSVSNEKMNQKIDTSEIDLGNQQNGAPRYTNAKIKILEQPASKAMRFRYECEGRSAGSIPGASSTPENKTFPTIQVHGYRGRAVVVVSCVTKDAPYRPHPHNLVGKEGCRKGVCTIEVPVESMTVTFPNLGIRCVKKKDIEEALKMRESIRVDPFRTGFSHRTQPSSIDLNAVRLCFQVFLEGSVPGKFTVPLMPVVSDPIYDKKSMSDLCIFNLSDDTSPVDGGKKIILLCEKVTKEDIQIRFYQRHPDTGHVQWESFAEFQPSDVHRQVAIAFKTPRFPNPDITEPTSNVYIQLVRPSDKSFSDALPFYYTAHKQEQISLNNKRKRQHYTGESQDNLYKAYELQTGSKNIPDLNIVDEVKIEPPDMPKVFMGTLSPAYSPDNDLIRYNPSPVLSPSPLTPLDDNTLYSMSPSYQNNLNIPQMINNLSPNPHSPEPLITVIKNSPQHQPQYSIMTVGDNNNEFQHQYQYMVTPQTSNWMDTKPAIPAQNDLNRTKSVFINPNLMSGGIRIQTTNAQPTKTTNQMHQAKIEQESVRRSNVPMNMSIENTPLFGSALNLDSQDLGQLNSAEIAANLNVFDMQLSENLSSSLSLIDKGPCGDEQRGDDGNNMNISDSFTRLARSTIEELCNLNKLCNKNGGS